jgi:hypothetical protein
MSLGTDPPHFILMMGINILGLEIGVAGRVPFLEKFRPYIRHPLFALILQALAKCAFPAPDPVTNRSQPPMAIFAKPPHLPSGSRGYIPRA